MRMLETMTPSKPMKDRKRKAKTKAWAVKIDGHLSILDLFYNESIATDTCSVIREFFNQKKRVEVCSVTITED